MEAKQTNKSIMTIRTVLGLAGLDITKRIKLVRHKDSRDVRVETLWKNKLGRSVCLLNRN